MLNNGKVMLGNKENSVSIACCSPNIGLGFKKIVLKKTSDVWLLCSAIEIDSFIKQHVFQQFEQALTTDQNELLLDEPLTSEDCRFLESISLPSTEKSTMLDLGSFTKKDIQGYRIVFKVLHGMNNISPTPIYPHFVAVFVRQWCFSP